MNCDKESGIKVQITANLYIVSSSTLEISDHPSPGFPFSGIDSRPRVNHAKVELRPFCLTQFEQ